MSTKATKENPPVQRIEVWPVVACIWQNGERYNTTFELRYKAQDSDEWKSGFSYGRDQLLMLSKAADLAHSWILRAEYEDRKGTNWRKAEPETKQ